MAWPAWPKEKCLKLIEEYERYPQLWNPKDSFYYNKVKKHTAWVNIAANLGCTKAEAKRKMDGLLVSFRRVKARGFRIEGEKLVPYTNWFAFEHLGFLLNKDEPEASQYSENCSDNIYLEDLVDYNVEVVHGSEDPSHVPSGDHQEEPQSQEKATKRTHCDSSGPTSCGGSNEKKGRMIQNSKVDNKFTSTSDLLLEDACSTYGRHVAHKLRGLDEKSRVMAEHEINNILHNYDLRRLDSSEHQLPNPDE